MGLNREMRSIHPVPGVLLLSTGRHLFQSLFLTHSRPFVEAIHNLEFAIENMNHTSNLSVPSEAFSAGVRLGFFSSFFSL